jgi:hypothetical protein
MTHRDVILPPCYPDAMLSYHDVILPRCYPTTMLSYLPKTSAPTNTLYLQLRRSGIIIEGIKFEVNESL